MSEQKEIENGTEFRMDKVHELINDICDLCYESDANLLEVSVAITSIKSVINAHFSSEFSKIAEYIEEETGINESAN